MIVLVACGVAAVYLAVEAAIGRRMASDARAWRVLARTRTRELERSLDLEPRSEDDWLQGVAGGILPRSGAWRQVNPLHAACAMLRHEEGGQTVFVNRGGACEDCEIVRMVGPGGWPTDQKVCAGCHRQVDANVLAADRILQMVKQSR